MLKHLFPIFSWLPHYKRAYVSGDVSAGLTVGVILIPQGMAYAMIAGLPPVFGLYAALIPQVVYAVMGTSRQLAVGPVAMDSLLIASGLGALSLSGIDEYIAMALFLSLFMGAIQLLMGILRVGFLVNFLSRPVVSGFTSGAAIIIGFSQLNHLFGITIERSSQIHTLLKNVWKTSGEIHIPTLWIGLTAIVLLLFLKRINAKFPAALIVVIIGIVGVYFFKMDTWGVRIVENIPNGLPSFSVPVIDYSRISDLMPIALTLALIAFMEAISVAKSVQEKQKEYEVNANQELIALGSANIIGSLFQSYPTTGGFSRTAVNNQAGAKTGVAALISAGVIGVTLLFLTPLFYYLPHAVLAAIVLVAVFGLMDVKYPLQLYQNRKDEFALLLFTFIITVVIGIKEGILLGVLISLLLLVYRTSQPHFAVLGRIKKTNYFRNINRFEADVEVHPQILIIRFDGQLYFGNKDYFKNELLKQVALKGDALKVVIIKSDPIHYIDSSASFMLQDVVALLHQKDTKILFSNVIGPTRDILHKTGLVNAIGRQYFFVNLTDAYAYALHHTPKNDIQDKISMQTKPL